MSEPQAEPSTELVLAHSGELVDLTNERQIAEAFQDVQEIQQRLAEANRILREAMNERAKVLGSRTIYIDGLGKVEVRNATQIVYPDPQELEAGLRAIDCPEEIIREIVVETIVYKVDGARAKRAAAVNPEYAKVIEAAQRVIEKTPTVSIT